MSARRFGLAALLLAAACARPDAGRPPLPAGAAAGYDVLLITLDTTRADRLGCYGYAEASTPALDGLAASGVRFEHAFTPVPITLPSHTTMLTGQLPPVHGVRDNAEYRLGPGTSTLAERLRAGGYRTAAFVSAFVLESRYGLDRGFDLYEDREGFDPSGAIAGHILERDAATVMGRAADWIAALDDDRPFFLWTHFFDPHQPYRPPEPWATRFAGREYDGEIAYMDAQIGKLLQALSRAGRRERTLVVVAGDHGEGLGEHGEETHAMLIYDSVMRVPLIVAAPGAIPGGGVEGRMVSLADILPTVLGLLRLPDDVRRDGMDLTREAPADDRAVYLESLTPYLHHGWAPLFALRRSGDKFIEAPIAEYYDLVADPGETNNLAANGGAADPELAASIDDLRGELALRLEGWPHFTEAAVAAEDLDVATLEKLRALGYVGAGARPEATLADPKERIAVVQHIHRAGALLGAGRAEQALAEIRLAAAISPRDRTVLQTMGAIYLLMGRAPEAEAALRAFHEIRPSADVCALLAQICMKDGRRAEAHALLDQAEALDPEHGVIWLTRGDLLAAEGDRAAAIVAWEHAAASDPSLAQAASSRIERARAAQRPR